jgi:hypothetical protein
VVRPTAARASTLRQAVIVLHPRVAAAATTTATAAARGRAALAHARDVVAREGVRAAVVQHGAEAVARVQGAGAPRPRPLALAATLAAIAIAAASAAAISVHIHHLHSAAIAAAAAIKINSRGLRDEFMRAVTLRPPPLFSPPLF